MCLDVCKCSKLRKVRRRRCFGSALEPSIRTCLGFQFSFFFLVRFFLFFFFFSIKNFSYKTLSSLSSLSLFPLSRSIVLIKQCTFCIIVSLCRSILLLLLLILALLFFLGLLVMYLSRRRTTAIAPRSAGFEPSGVGNSLDFLSPIARHRSIRDL